MKRTATTGTTFFSENNLESVSELSKEAEYLEWYQPIILAIFFFISFLMLAWKNTFVTKISSKPDYLLFFNPNLPFESMMINGIVILIIKLSNSGQCYLQIQHYNSTT